MIKNENTEKKAFVLPEGMMCQYCCGDCIFMDLSSTNKYGEAWCGKRRKYYKPSDAARYCQYFTAK